MENTPTKHVLHVVSNTHRDREQFYGFHVGIGI
jgi:hypothetical protein